MRLAATSLVLLATSLTACSGSGSSTASDPIRRAARVLHVDPDVARYTLDLTADGGALTIGIDGQFASEQIERARDFLRAQQPRLLRGDVRGLRALLGTDAPGLAALAGGHRDLRVAYIDVPEGGRLVLRTTRPALVTAVHRMLDGTLVRFGDVAIVPTTESGPSTTTSGPSAPSGFLG